MKRTFLLLLLLLAVFKAGARLREVVCYNGWKIRLGDTIVTGKGSQPLGFYKQVWYVPYIKGQVPHSNIDGSRMIVIKEYLTPMKRNLRQRLEDEKGAHYTCAVDAALKAGEVVAPKNFWNYRKHPLGPVVTYAGDIAVGNQQQALHQLTSWFKGYYNDTTSRINKVDESKGTFSGVACFDYRSNFSLGNAEIKGTICYSLNISVKEGKLHYEFTDFIHQPSNHAKGAFSAGFLLTVPNVPEYAMDRERGTHWSQKMWTDMKQQADSVMKIVIPKFRNAIDH